MSAITNEPAKIPPAPSPRPKRGPLMTLAQYIASLKVTVVLFVLSFLLVFLGTLAQVDQGIGTVIRNYFRSWVCFIPLQTLVVFGQKFFGLPTDWRTTVAFPYPAGLTLGIALMINLLAAHALRFKVSWQRAGILITHAGLIVLLVGEFMTAAYAVEGRMSITEGQTVNTVANLSRHELAVIEPAGKEKDSVTTVPARMLRTPGTTVSDDALPFDIVVKEWHVNSILRDAKRGEKNPATAGFGKEIVIKSLAETAGTAEDQTVDIPAMYADLRDKKSGASLGVYLLSPNFRNPQPVKIGDREYQIALRFQQTTRPFSLKLLKFTFDKHPGTNTALNFASLVHLFDPETGDDRDVVISMNAPLRHRGETFFQADWDKDTEKGTVLQVVRNPGWLLPYVSCALVTIGLCVHFGFVLANFLGKRGGA
jgi:hypothetical protein